MDIQVIKEIITKECAVLDIYITAEQVDLMMHFAKLVFEANKRMNLTRITSNEEFAVKHLIDCLLLSKVGCDFKGSGIDVGSGAGFPGVVIAGCITTSPVTLLDSLEKRVNFLLQVKDKLSLTNVECVHARAEDLARDKNYREKFTWATARAVAPLPVLLEYCAAFVEVGGYFLAMKGNQNRADDEISDAKNAIKVLGLELISVYKFELPLNMGERTIIKMKKKIPISKGFPRKAGIPSKKPL